MSTFLKSCLMTIFGCAEQDLWHGEDGIVLLDDSEQAELLGFDLSSALHLSVRSTHTRQKAPGDAVRSLGSEPSSSAVGLAVITVQGFRFSPGSREHTVIGVTHFWHHVADSAIMDSSV